METDPPKTETVLQPDDEMSEARLQLRFDGPELAAHEMDVSVLAPSLMAFGEICKEANHAVNGERAKIRVMISADVKANCVTLDLSVVQSAWEAAKSLVKGDNIASAWQILEWLGFFTKAGFVTWGVVKFLLWKRDRKEESAETKIEDSGNVVVVKIVGDNNTVTIPQPVYLLSKNVRVVESLKNVVRPVSDENGIDDATFIYKKKEQLKVGKEDAAALQEVHADSDVVEPQLFTAHAVIHAPVLDTRSKKWKFKLNNRVETIDISETHIVQDVLERGGIKVGDTYKLRIEMIERQKENGSYVADYKAKELLDFIPGSGTQAVDLIKQ